MANITMKQAIAFKNSVDVFDQMQLPLKSAYKLNKIKRAIDQETDFYSTQFQELIDKYSKKDENGQMVFSDDGTQIIIQPDKIAECNQELENLENLPVKVDTYNLSIDDFGDEIECNPKDLEALMPFLN